MLGRARAAEDRRKWERIQLVIPLFINGTDSDGEKFSDLTSAQDIGAGGVLFASQRSLSTAAKLTIQVPFAPWLSKLAKAARNSRALRGRVVRVVATKSFNYTSAYKYRDMINKKAADGAGSAQGRIA